MSTGHDSDSSSHMQGTAEAETTALPNVTVVDAREAVWQAWRAINNLWNDDYELDRLIKIGHDPTEIVVAIVHELVDSDAWRTLTLLRDFDTLHMLPSLSPWLRDNLQAYLDYDVNLDNDVRQSVQIMLECANRQHRAKQYADAIWNGLPAMVAECRNAADGDMLVMLVARELAAEHADELWYGMHELAVKQSDGWTLRRTAKP